MASKQRRKKRGRGQPRALQSKAIRKKLLDTLRSGHGIKEAVALIGYTYQTLRNECNRDSKFEQEVQEAARQGRIVAKATAKGTLLRAIGKEWRAAVTYLERMYPEEWSKHRHVTHDGEVEVNHSTDVAALRHELLNDDNYLDFLRRQAVADDGNAGPVRADGQQGQVEDGAASRPNGSEARSGVQGAG